MFGGLLATAAWSNGDLWKQAEREARTHMQAGRPEQALDVLLAHETALTGNTDYDYLLGVLALELGRLNLAHAALERVVLVNPAHAGAWLDLAIVAHRQQDPATALQLLDYVEANFSPAPALRDQIHAVRARLAVPLPDGRWRARLEIGRGHDANANNGLQGTGLQLTPQGASPVWAEYAPGLKPRPDGFWQTRLGAERTLWANSTNKIDIAGDLYAKEHDHLTEYDLLDAGLNVRYGHALDAHAVLAITGQIREIRIDGQAFLRRSLLGGAWEKTQGAWEGKLLFDNEWRHYRQSGYADSQTPWLGGWLGWRDEQTAAGFSLRHGKEDPQSARAGGATFKTETALLGRRQLPRQWTLSATLFMARYRDRDGYSPLLDNGARRRIDRTAAFIELTRPLAPQWKIGFELHLLRDRSNLAISRQEDQQALITLSYFP